MLATFPLVSKYFDLKKLVHKRLDSLYKFSLYYNYFSPVRLTMASVFNDYQVQSERLMQGLNFSLSDSLSAQRTNAVMGPVLSRFF